VISKFESKTIPVTGREGVEGCEMLWIPHCLDNRLTDGQPYALAFTLLPRNIIVPSLVLISVRG
jgi:hypothetical protein